MLVHRRTEPRNARSLIVITPALAINPAQKAHEFFAREAELRGYQITAYFAAAGDRRNDLVIPQRKIAPKGITDVTPE